MQIYQSHFIHSIIKTDNHTALSRRCNQVPVSGERLAALLPFLRCSFPHNKIIKALFYHHIAHVYEPVKFVFKNRAVVGIGKGGYITVRV